MIPPRWDADRLARAQQRDSQDEDVVFDLDLRRMGCTFVMEPRANVGFRPRGSLTAFFRQYYRYARGDGKARRERIAATQFLRRQELQMHA